VVSRYRLGITTRSSPSSSMTKQFDRARTAKPLMPRSSCNLLRDGGRCRIRTHDFHRVKADLAREWSSKPSEWAPWSSAPAGSRRGQPRFRGGG
jgi:hypothetical protein